MSENTGTSMSGWNFTLQAALRKAGGVANLSSAIAVSQKVVDKWIARLSMPTPRALRAMRKYLDAGNWARREADRVAIRMLSPTR